MTELEKAIYAAAYISRFNELDHNTNLRLSLKQSLGWTDDTMPVKWPVWCSERAVEWANDMVKLWNMTKRG